MRSALKNSFETREQWLTALIRSSLAEIFAEHGAKIPENVRVSCAWPARRALARINRNIGQAWSTEASADGTYEIMVSMCLDDPLEVAAVVAHECVHISVGLEHGHRGPFKRLALAIGLEGRMTATVAGEAFKRRIRPYLDELGPYPHAKLDVPALQQKVPETPEPRDTPYYSGPRKQNSRLLKAQCANCGYTIRLSRLWIRHATPCCPDPNCADHNVAMIVEPADRLTAGGKLQEADGACHA